MANSIRDFVKNSLNTYYKNFQVKLDDSPISSASKSVIKITNNNDVYIKGIGGYNGGNPANASSLQYVVNNVANNIDDNNQSTITTYSSNKIMSLVDARLKIVISSNRPSNPDQYTLYFIPNSTPSQENYYDEYMWINNNWELIGSTLVDLSNYYDKDEIDVISSSINSSINDLNTSINDLNTSINDLNTSIANLHDYYAGDNIEITLDNSINALGYKYESTNFLIGNGSVLQNAEYSFIQGFRTNNGDIYANTIGSFSRGYADHGTIATFGKGSCAEGCVENYGVIDASGLGSHAEGYANNASINAVGNGAHAEGCASIGNIYAVGEGAHAEGINTLALNYGAHSEGVTTYAIAAGSHAEGIGTTAEGWCSHAGGNMTIANQEAMTAIGKYNNTSVGNIGGTYLFSVGNGEFNSRSNAFSVTTNGITATTLNLSGGKYQNSRIGGTLVFGDFDDEPYTCYIAENIDDVLIISADNGIRMYGKVWMKNNLEVVNDVSCNTLHVQTGAYQTSDINLKNVISEDISIDKIYEMLEKCHTILYTLKGDESKKELIGMIAQEIQEYFPEVVSVSDDGTLSLDYSRLSVILFRLCNDLVKKNKEINLRLNVIEEKLNKLL